MVRVCCRVFDEADSPIAAVMADALLSNIRKKALCSVSPDWP